MFQGKIRIRENGKGEFTYLQDHNKSLPYRRKKMKLNFHPEARRNFNQKACSILNLIAPIPDDLMDGPKPSFRPEIVGKTLVVGTFTIHNVYSLRDRMDREVGKYFIRDIDNQALGYYGDPYRQLRKLAESIQRTDTCRSVISEQTVVDSIFDWVKHKISGKTRKKVITFIKDSLEQRIQDWEVLVPIHKLQIESTFRLGEVRFVQMTKDILDRWQLKSEQNIYSTQDQVEKAFASIRAEIQGYATCMIEVVAEVHHAVDVAKRKVSQAVSLLRLFEPSNLEPELVSHIVPLGSEHVEGYNVYLASAGTLEKVLKGFEGKGPRNWVIQNAYLNAMESGGLRELDRILRSNRRSPFEERLLECLITYSKSSLSHDLSDRLLFVMVALERMFLRDRNEAVAQNVGERIAFLNEKDAKTRKAVISNFKKTYDLRSTFVHHGERIEDVDTCREFLKNAWKCFLELVTRSSEFTDQAQLIDQIETEKLT